MNLAERKKKLRQTGLWCSLEISEIGYVAVFFVLLVTMMVSPVPERHWGSVAPAITPHAVNLPGALREDSIQIAVMRDGVVFLGSDRLTVDSLASRLKESLRSGSYAMIYIRADERARYGDILDVVDAIHEAGIEQIGFLTETRSQFP